MFTAYLRDITARKHAEESSLQLASIVESSNDAIFSKTLEGRITSWNRSAETIYGYGESEIIGRSVRILVPPDRIAQFDDLMDRLKRGEGTTSHETERICKDGTRIDVSLTISPIRSATGQILGASTIARDITLRKRAERERAELLARERQARADADAANRAKDEFLSTVSHELRTPLNAILGWAHLMQEGQLDSETVQRACETILRNARSQQRIIEDILDLSRIVSGNVRLDMRPVDLEPIVAAAMESVRPAAEGKGIDLGFVPGSETARVLGDPERIQQIVWNLLTNATKFTPKGGAVRVRLGRSHRLAEIEVSDTGSGIRADLLPHIFDRFRQGDSTSTRHHGGLGLGLAIVRHLAELQEGSVAAASPGEGRGSVFTVRFPLMLGFQVEKTRGIDADVLSASASNRLEEGLLSGLKVLVVDDEIDSRFIIMEILKRNGASVASAGSSREALEYARSHPLDVLVSDIGMPEQDGYDLIRAVRTLPAGSARDVRAIALTAYARIEDRARALKEGFQMHLAKPVDPNALIAAILTVAGRSAANG